MLPLLLFFFFPATAIAASSLSRFDDLYGGDRDGRESGGSKRERIDGEEREGREKIIKKRIFKAIVTHVYIYIRLL